METWQGPFLRCGRLMNAEEIKVLLFTQNRAEYEKRKRIGCLFVKNTQTLFQKSKTDVQGAENVYRKQIDMAQTSNCDKIKADMRICARIVRIVEQQ